jgi:putative transposase
MPRRRGHLINDAWYHVYNRSVGKERIFSLAREISRCYSLIDYYRFPAELSYSHVLRLPESLLLSKLQDHLKQSPLIEIHGYAIMPNHYHFLIKQLEDDGIKDFIGNFQNGYAKYFNKRNERHGSLFCSSFKAKHIGEDDEWVHILRYIELNPVTSKMIPIESLETYPHTSFRGRYSGEKNSFITSDMVSGKFDSFEEYKNFVYNQAEYQIQLREIKHLLVD